MTVYGPIPTRYTVSLIPDSHYKSHNWELHVEWRGAGRWAIVTNFRRCLSRSGDWHYEVTPSERGEKFVGCKFLDQLDQQITEDLQKAFQKRLETQARVAVNNRRHFVIESVS